MISFSVCILIIVSVSTCPLIRHQVVIIPTPVICVCLLIPSFRHLVIPRPRIIPDPPILPVISSRLSSVEELGGDTSTKGFGHLDIKRLYDLFQLPAGFEEPPFHELNAVQELLDTHRLTLKRIFRFYSSGTGPAAQVTNPLTGCGSRREKEG